jgi:hypothetical protein
MFKNISSNSFKKGLQVKKDESMITMNISEIEIILIRKRMI